MKVKYKDMDIIKFPWYMGYSYSRPEKLRRYYYVIPLNLIIKLARTIWIVLQVGYYTKAEKKLDDTLHDREGEVYQLGYQDGMDAGKRKWIMEGEKKVYDRLTTYLEKKKDGGI